MCYFKVVIGLVTPIVRNRQTLELSICNSIIINGINSSAVQSNLRIKYLINLTNRQEIFLFNETFSGKR